MISWRIVLNALGLVVASHLAAGSNTKAQHPHPVSKRGSKSIMQWDFNTISTCTEWYDNYEGLSCKEVRDWRYAISPEDFLRWNPSITLDCGNWRELAYCVDVESERTSSSTASSTLRTTSTTVAPIPTRKPELLGWEPLGCYVDDETLHNHTTKAGGGGLTVTECEAACFADGFEYAGVKGGADCWCGGFVGNSWTENQGDCNIPCPGNAAQTCGGVSVFNVFEAKTRDTLPPLSSTRIDSSISGSSTTAGNTISTTSASFTTNAASMASPTQAESSGMGRSQLADSTVAWLAVAALTAFRLHTL